MDVHPEKISAVLNNAAVLEKVIHKLEQKMIARHDITVQGSPDQLEDLYGKEYVNPKTIKESHHPPQKEPFLNDDFGWVMGFAFALPIFLCAIVGILIAADTVSTSNNYMYGAFGALFGAAIGAVITGLIKKHHDKIICRQEKKGGFVLWVRVNSASQKKHVLSILKKHKARHVSIT